MRRLALLAVGVAACSSLGSPVSTLSAEDFEIWCDAFEEYQIAVVASYYASELDSARALEESVALWRAVLVLDQPPELEGLFPAPFPETREDLEAQARIETEVLDWVDELADCGYPA